MVLPPGRNRAVVGPTTAVVLVGDAGLGLAERIWALVGNRPADVERVLDEMTSDGLAGLPSFVLVEPAGESVRTLVRGTAMAQLRHGGADSTMTVSGAGFRSWHEEVVADVADAVLADSGAPLGEGPLRPIAAGNPVGQRPPSALRRRPPSDLLARGFHGGP